MAQRLQTGIQRLDKALSGGIPPGAIVTVTSDSRTQSELFLHRIIAENDTRYITTIGNEETVKAEFAKSPVDIGTTNITYASPDATLSNTRTAIEEQRDAKLTVINIVNDIEGNHGTTRGEYQQFLNWLQNKLRNTGGVVIFHRYATGVGKGNSHITNSMSDIILELEEVTEGEGITNYLHMPKCRGAGAIDERLKVSLTDGLSIDTSRDIA